MLYNDTTYLKFQVDAQCYRNGGHSDYSFVKGIAASFDIFAPKV